MKLHNFLVRSAAELLDVIPLAFNIAESGGPGPVVIDVPKDVQLQECEFEQWPEFKSALQKTIIPPKLQTKLLQ